MRDLFTLNQRRILITGSSRGLGWAMARAMAEAGATVILNGRDRDLLEQRRKELEAQGYQIDTEAFFVAATKNAIAGMRAIADHHGGLKGLVNNAFIQHRQPIQDFELSDYDRLMGINLHGCFLLSREAARLMQKKGSGRIINIASVMGPQARKTFSAYTTSKGGIVKLTKVLAVEIGPQGIRCNANSPGFFTTEMNTVLVEVP